MNECLCILGMYFCDPCDMYHLFKLEVDEEPSRYRGYADEIIILFGICPSTTSSFLKQSYIILNSLSREERS